MNVIDLASSAVIVVVLLVATLFWQTLGDQRLIPNPTRRFEARRRVRRLLRTGSPFILALVGLSLLIGGCVGRWSRNPLGDTLELAGFVAIGAGIVASRLRLKALRRRVEAIQFEACLECEYPLMGLPFRGQCPECGFEYDKNLLKSGWEEVWKTARLHT